MQHFALECICSAAGGLVRSSVQTLKPPHKSKSVWSIRADAYKSLRSWTLHTNMPRTVMEKGHKQPRTINCKIDFGMGWAVWWAVQLIADFNDECATGRDQQLAEVPRCRRHPDHRHMHC